ncbi:MAG: response regulator [Phenylobacterium sp.]
MNLAAPARLRHLLVVDDDDRIRELLRTFLGRKGFKVSVASGAGPARQLLEALDFDLAVLDVMMPGEDGLSFAGWVRSQPGRTGAMPILMLTARGDPIDRIEGLRRGADDYLSKPFEPEELVLRIDSILRRASRAPDPVAGELSLGPCIFDPTRGELIREGRPVKLTETEVNLLRRLARNPHEAVDRQELIQPDVDPAGRAIDIQVTRLRRKMEVDPRAPRYLQTVRGIGYLLAPD